MEPTFRSSSNNRLLLTGSPGGGKPSQKLLFLLSIQKKEMFGSSKKEQKEELAAAKCAGVDEQHEMYDRDFATHSWPELRIIHDNERNRVRPIVVWGGWLTDETLRTSSGVLPTGYDGYVIEYFDRKKSRWESVGNPELLFGQLMHTKKHVAV